MPSKKKYDETFAEQIDYKSIIINQIEFIHEGIQLGNQQMINNGIVSLEVLLFPKLEEDTYKELENLNKKVEKKIVDLKSVPYGRSKGQHETDKAKLNFDLQLEKYQLLLKFCESKDLLLTEIETEEL